MNQQKLPNATAVLILGIASIVTCCCYGVLGIILGGIGLFLSKKDIQLYKQNPSMYDNYGTLNAGKILCIIGIILSVIYIIYLIVVIATFGFEGLSNPQIMRERIEGLGY